MPPIIVSVATRLRKKTASHEYLYQPDGWREDAARGWNVESVLESGKAKWPELLNGLQGTQPLSAATGSSSLFAHNLIVSYCYALARVAHGKSTLSLLDWGGGIGAYNLISIAAMPELEIDYHCKDLPLMTSYGRTLQPNAHFYEDDSWQDRSYGFVLAGATLQYTREWQAALCGLAKATEGYFFLTRVPVHQEGASYVFLERAYESEWLGWSFNRQELLHSVKEAGLELEREFIIADEPVPVTGASCPFELRGFLFKRIE